MIQRALMIFFPAALLGITVLYLLFDAQDRAVRSITFAEQQKLIEIGRQRLLAELHSVASDLRYLAKQRALQQLLAAGDAAARANLTADYLTFLTEKGSYDQVRFLDATGHEIVRVNWNNGAPHAVTERELQDKADRYYVRDTLKLGVGQLYVSQFDLNIEHGAVEQPIKPMLRLATPVFDDRGQVRGLVVLNYLGQRLIDRIAALAVKQGDQVWLLDADGYWLRGPSPEMEWAFMFPERQDRSFAQGYPEAWKAIGGAREPGQILFHGDLITYARVSVSLDARTAGGGASSDQQQPYWILLSDFPAASLAEQSAELKRGMVAAAIGLLLVFAIGSWGLASYSTARQRGAESLRHSEARFRTLLDSAPDAIVVTNSRGEITIVNTQTERLLGYSRDQLIGHSVEILLPEQYRARHVDHRGAYIASPLARAMGAGLRLAARRLDGAEIPVAISLSPSQTEQGLMVFCSIRDITKERDAEQRMEELNNKLTHDNAELEALNRELEAFSYSVSHDLRAPLRSIDGFSQALLEDYGERFDANGRDFLMRIRNAAQRMGMLIDDLLKLARVTRVELTRENIDVSAMARDIAEALKEGGRERASEFNITDGLTAYADPRLMRVVLDNLLSNAWKFTKERRPARIELGRTRRNGEQVYFVRDNGVGFDMAHAGRLFGAFQRLHHESEFPGTGVGLATVQRIIRRHGGQIWAEAEAGRGASFYFTI